MLLIRRDKRRIRYRILHFTDVPVRSVSIPQCFRSLYTTLPNCTWHIPLLLETWHISACPQRPRAGVQPLSKGVQPITRGVSTPLLTWAAQGANDTWADMWQPSQHGEVSPHVPPSAYCCCTYKPNAESFLCFLWSDNVWFGSLHDVCNSSSSMTVGTLDEDFILLTLMEIQNV